MSPADLLLIGLAGLAAGFLNTVVGSGSLVTFPTLVALGLPPVSANITNNLGLIPGSLSGTWGYRHELMQALDPLKQLLPAAAIGGALGAGSLLIWPDRFGQIVPVLVMLAVVLVLVGPRIRAWSASREHPLPAPLLSLGVGASSVYGGYFGAAQGVLLLGVLGTLLNRDLQQLNAVKNALAATVNAIAAVVFFAVQPQAIEPTSVVAIAIGSTIGGQLGARVGRKLPAPVLRGVIVVVGIVALVVLLR